MTVVLGEVLGLEHHLAETLDAAPDGAAWVLTFEAKLDVHTECLFGEIGFARQIRVPIEDDGGPAQVLPGRCGAYGFSLSVLVQGFFRLVEIGAGSLKSFMQRGDGRCLFFLEVLHDPGDFFPDFTDDAVVVQHQIEFQEHASGIVDLSSEVFKGVYRGPDMYEGILLNLRDVEGGGWHGAEQGIGVPYTAHQPCGLFQASQRIELAECIMEALVQDCLKATGFFTGRGKFGFDVIGIAMSFVVQVVPGSGGVGAWVCASLTFVGGTAGVDWPVSAGKRLPW